MKKLLFTLIGTVCISYAAFTQDVGKALANELKDCQCDEIILISGGYEKKYVHDWIESIEYKDGFIVLSKGSQKHMWNAEKVVAVEKGGTYVRVYFEQIR